MFVMMVNWNKKANDCYLSEQDMGGWDDKKSL